MKKKSKVKPLSRAQMRRIVNAPPKAKKPPKKSSPRSQLAHFVTGFDIVRGIVQTEVARYLKSNAVQPKKELHMSRKSAMLALASAVAACAAAAQALASEESDATPEPKPEPEAKLPKAPKAPKETPAAAAAEPPKVPAVEKQPEPAPKAVNGGEAVTFDKLKDAFKGYAEVYGVADAKAKMLKHTPEGKKTLGDIPPEKYAEAYADFKV